MDDLISRKAAIDALRYAQHRFTVADEAGGMGTVKWSEDVIYFDAAVNVLSLLPATQPERKKGKWIEIENEWGGLEIICSECRAQAPRDAWGNAVQSDYCYRCGADMRGEQYGRSDK